MAISFGAELVHIAAGDARGKAAERSETLLDALSTERQALALMAQALAHGREEKLEGQGGLAIVIRSWQPTAKPRGRCGYRPRLPVP